MVTWGANTVHNIGTGGGGGAAAAAAATATGTPSSSSSTSLFGNSSTTSTATSSTTTATTPTASGGFSFGSSTNTTTIPTTTITSNTGGFSFGGGGGGTNTTVTPSTTGGLFGSSTTTTTTTTTTPPPPASTTGGLFGSSSFFGGTPAPSSGGLFGSSNNTHNSTSSIFGNTGSIFGNTSSNTSGSIFGSPTPTLQQQQQQQPPQIPAHAALQAHMNAYARNEEARVLQRMQTIHQTYTGTSIATNEKSHCFSIPLYNPITEQQRQLQDAVSTIVMTTNNQGFMVSSALVAPTKPAQMSEEDWKLACIRNPDANHFIPTAVVGANSLLARAILHQEKCHTIQKHMVIIQEAIQYIQQRHGEITRLLEIAIEHHQKQCTRLLKIMKAVEVKRCFNMSLQSTELDAFQQIRHLKYSIIEEQLVPDILQLTNSLHHQSNKDATENSETTTATTTSSASASSSISNSNTIPMEKQELWMTILKDHRHQLGVTTKALQKEQQDLQLLHDRVITGSNKSNNHSMALFK